jgi:hypothetical protein
LLQGITGATIFMGGIRINNGNIYVFYFGINVL